jgi:glucan phosphoethanolaminetransferase (alkaline phosphatase superfamily)
MFVFFDYFRHYRLKVLQIVILTVFITEVIFKSNLLTNILESTWKKAIFLTVNAIWILATIVMIAFLFQAKMKDYPGIRSVRKYAISILFFYVLVPTVPLFVEPDSTFSTQQLVEIIFVIPYVFVIDFAMKLPSK